MQTTTKGPAMSDTDQPAAKPSRRLALGPGVVLLLLVAVAAVVMMVKGVGGEPEPTSEERLCTLIRGGATSAELVAGDAWRAWPDSYSVSTREQLIRVGAEQGGCGDLVF
jgi:hypothetical protein